MQSPEHKLHRELRAWIAVAIVATTALVVTAVIFARRELRWERAIYEMQNSQPAR